MNYLFCSILFAVPKLRMESFLLSLLSGSGPIESYTLLYSSLLLGIRYCNYHLQDKNTLQEKHVGLQMQNAQEIRIRLSRCVSFSDHKCLRQKLKITFARCNFKPFDTQRCINDTLLTFYWKKIIINQNQLNKEPCLRTRNNMFVSSCNLYPFAYAIKSNICFVGFYMGYFQRYHFSKYNHAFKVNFLAVKFAKKVSL